MSIPNDSFTPLGLKLCRRLTDGVCRGLHSAVASRLGAKALRSRFLVLFCFAALTIPLFAQSWRIADFQDTVLISEDGTALVKERISLVFIGAWHGIHRTMKKALARVTDGTDYVHVSFDLDAVDPTVAPGVGTPVKGGLDYREAHLIMELLHDSGVMTSLEMVEVNPILDQGNASAAFAVELVQSAFGKKIL